MRAKRWVRHVFTVYINRKPHMMSPMTSSHLTLSDIERSNSRSLRFQSLVSCEYAEIGHMLLLNINRKAYMTSPMILSHLTLSDLERSNSRSLIFRSLISCKGAELGYMLLLNINRKAYMGSPMIVTFDLEWPWKVNSRLLRFRNLIISSRSWVRPYVTIKHE